MKKTFLALIIFLAMPVFASAASSVNVSYIGAPSPLFNETNLAPGQEITKTITVTSGVSTNQQFKFKASTAGSSQSALADVINIKIINVDTNVQKYNNTLSNMYGAGEINLDVLAPNTPIHYNFVATFIDTAGNDYENLIEKFDLSIGFAAEPTTNPAIDGGVSSPANPVAALATALGFNPTTTNVTPAVRGAETQNQNGVKGNEDKTSGVKACPWWWILSLILAGIFFVYGYYLKKRKTIIETWVSFYWIVIPVIFGILAFFAHSYLEGIGNYAQVFFCQYYWGVALVETLVAIAIYYFILGLKKPRG